MSLSVFLAYTSPFTTLPQQAPAPSEDRGTTALVVRLQDQVRAHAATIERLELQLADMANENEKLETVGVCRSEFLSMHTRHCVGRIAHH